MTTKQKLPDIIAVLVIIKDRIEANKFPATGLCSTFLEIHGESLSPFMRLYGVSFEDWPHYSGYKKFPVPDPARKRNALQAEEIYWNTTNRYTGEYGKLRMQLLDWLIEQFEVKLKCHELKIIVQSLLEIKSTIQANRLPPTGLCNTFFRVHGSSLDTCMSLYGISFEYWTHYSGDISFPVPDPNPSLSAAVAYHDKGLYGGNYGKLRMQLLDWLIEQFEAVLKCPMK